MAIGIIPMAYKFWYRYFKKDPSFDSIASNNGAYQYLKRYMYAFNPQLENNSICPISETEYVWICWLQGEHMAPPLVQRCIESVKLHCKDRKVVVLSNENIADFIEIPSYVITKMQAGIISMTHYSDIVRLSLLSKYGGIWIDSTILMTGPMPDYILESPFFLFHSASSLGHVLCANGFMAACPHHPIIEDVKSFILEYWKKENRLVTYSVMHLAITLATEFRKIDRQYWESVPIYYYANNEILRQMLNAPYDKKQYERIVAITPIHKLTYKFEKYGIDPQKKGTFYDVLINGNTNSL